MIAAEGFLPPHRDHEKGGHELMTRPALFFVRLIASSAGAKLRSFSSRA